MRWGKSRLTKEEEVDLSKKIELGEGTILDAICSVPYLIDFIYDYKDALINRERRVKELFKSFEDEEEEREDSEDESDEVESEEESSGKKPINKKDQKRIEKVLENFKALDRAKKDWLKVLNAQEENAQKDEDELIYILLLAHKKQILKEKLLDLGPTSKLINELVK